MNFIITLIFLSTIFSETYFHENRFEYSENRQSDLIVNNNRDEQELIEFIESTMQTHVIPGLSISIVKDQNIVWEKYFGYSDIENEVVVDENTMFILSSVSKTVTATALMQLFENGLFSLDDDIDDYLPFNVNHPDYQLTPITFKMLLSHTSGIKDNWSVMPYYNGDSEFELSYYLEEYLVSGGQFYGSNSNFTNSMPGTNYIYSNIGAALIGLLVEEISNQPFNEYCYQNIFEPLAMDNAFWLLSEIEDLSQVALPYQFSGNNGNTCYEIGCGVYNSSNPCFCDYQCIYYDDCCEDYDEVCGEDGTGSDSANLEPQYHYGYSDYPSGQLRTTSNNLAKLMSTYINNGVHNGIRILDSLTVELIKTIHYPSIVSDQGLIWYYKNQNQRLLFGHNGGDLGSLTEMFVSFENNLGVVVLSNSNNYNAIIQIEDEVFNFAEQNNFGIIGDINFDENIDILDIILVINIILGIEPFNDLADINQDNMINILDVVQLVNIILT